MRGRSYHKDQPYDKRVGALSHSELILTSREGRLGLESEFNCMGHDLINPAYIMKPQSEARCSFPGWRYSVGIRAVLGGEWGIWCQKYIDSPATRHNLLHRYLDHLSLQRDCTLAFRIDDIMLIGPSE